MITYEFLQLCKSYNGGEGRYLAKCPCGCARRRTLHVKAEDGITLIYCESGCNPYAVAGALGIKLNDLRDKRNMSWKTESDLCR